MAQKAKVASKYGRLEFLVGGSWKASGSERVQKVYDPGRGNTIAEVPFATREEVSLAIESSEAAFEKWSKKPIFERVKYLFRMHDVLEEHFEELSAINTQNHGKTIEESRGELMRSIENVECAIGTAYTIARGDMIDQIAEGIDGELVKEPLGVFAMICPFNFPLMIPFWFIPYAIVLGDTVVLKPSEVDPVPTTYAIKLIQDEVSPPAGVINLIHGSREVVETLIADRRTKGVTFVGSTPVARQIYKLAGEYGKRAVVNGGAKNSVVVMPDAPFDRTISPVVSSFFGNAGQRCLAGANLITIGRETHSGVVGKFAAAARELRVGYGLDDSTEMGPVVTTTAKERVVGYIERGATDGAKILVDGRNKKVKDYPNGFYIGPTILDGVTEDMAVAKEEIFGPVASVVSAESLDEAIEIINSSTNFGNMACIFTSSGSAARKFRRGVNAGNIGVNIGVAQPAAYFPFGGRKESFFGVLHPQIDTVDFFTDKKITISRW